MNQPQQPKDPPTEGAAPDSNPSGATPNGIPEGEGAEPKGQPSSDRHQTETTPTAP